MKTRCRTVVFVLILSALLWTPGVFAADEAMLQICLAAHADYSPVYATRSIPASAQEVTAVFRFSPGETHKKIIGKWIAVDVGTAAPPNHVMITKTLEGDAKKGRLSIELPRALPVGKYRLEVEADGKAWKSAEFNVVPDLPAPTLAGPEALLPLKQGQTWNSDFVQQAGSGAKINWPGVQPDAQGRYHANVSMTVAGSDAAGQHLELKRNGQLVFEEWWRLDQKGLSATKRKAGDEVSVLDPPQVLLPWPLKVPKTWSYSPRDGSYRQTYTLWGPVPIKTSGGDKPGYVVFVEQPFGAMTLTVERHFLPGVGLVREIIITGLDHDMVSRQEMVLKP